MAEYRHNLITDQWCIVAAERSTRPSDWRQTGDRGIADYDNFCPFCPGQEQQTPPEVFAARESGQEPDKPGWSVRVIPNKYPAVDKNASAFSDRHPFAAKAGRGIHEVIIESPHHSRHFGQHPPEHAELILATLRDRYRFHAKNSRETVKLISVFKNHGPSSGASLLHPHFQLIGSNIVPPRLAGQLQHCRNYYTNCHRSVFDEVIATELDEKCRLVAVNEHFVAFCPFASRVPLEIWLIPRQPQCRFGAISDQMIPKMAAILQHDILGRLNDELGNPDYNMAIHTAPNSEHDRVDFRWYVQIWPRLNNSGGFELATDIYINTVAPETAAAFYRNEGQ